MSQRPSKSKSSPETNEVILEINGRQVKVRIRTADAYQPNPDNSNQGKERGDAAIRKSMHSSRFHRGIAIAGDDVVMNGNHAYQNAVEENVIDSWVEIETDGTVGVATKRIDWKDHRDPHAIAAALFDNQTQHLNHNPDTGTVLKQLKLLEDSGYVRPKEIYTDADVRELAERYAKQCIEQQNPGGNSPYSLGNPTYQAPQVTPGDGTGGGDECDRSADSTEQSGEVSKLVSFQVLMESPKREIVQTAIAEAKQLRGIKKNEDALVAICQEFLKGREA